MNLKVIGTGSKGNCYFLESENECLIIDLGLRFSEIKKALNFDFSKVVGAIQDHAHGDHSKGTKEALSAGINVYMSQSDKQLLKINHHRAITIEAEKQFKLGGFTIKPFNVAHDIPCLGFLIHHKECGLTLFATDTFYIPNTFSGLNNILIEANYCNDIMREKLTDMEFLRNRILTSHMSIQTCLGFLAANDLSSVNNIILLHLSNSNSHEVMFKSEVENATGKTVTVASNGIEIPFGKTPF